MMCRSCGEKFDAADLLTAKEYVPYGEGVTTRMTQLLCPECGSDEVVRDMTCAQCGEQFPDSDIEHGLCRFCTAELHDTMEWVRSMLSSAQRAWVAEHPEWAEERRGRAC